MYKIGLTGGIGSGKTVVAKLFELLNIPVFYSDYEAKIIINNNAEVKKQITKEFGEMYYHNKLNSQKLAQIVFNNPKELLKLNNIVHPKVRERYNNWLFEKNNSKFTIKESAILFETGDNKNFDSVITVYAPVSLRIKRVCKRDKVDEKNVRKRIKQQYKDKIKIKMADFVILNNDKKMVLPQVLKIYNRIDN